MAGARYFGGVARRAHQSIGRPMKAHIVRACQVRFLKRSSFLALGVLSLGYLQRTIIKLLIRYQPQAFPLTKFEH